MAGLRTALVGMGVDLLAYFLDKSVGLAAVSEATGGGLR